MPRVPITPGMFSWIDLMTTDPLAAKPFYRSVFGWEYRDTPTDAGPPYTVVVRDGDEVAGMGEMPDHDHSFWNSYIEVEDVDHTAARAAELGGSIDMEPTDVLEAGRMAVIVDPTGAHVCLWQAADHQGAARFNEHGALAWNELVTRDPDAARRFYGELLGWTWEEVDLPQGTYWVIHNRDRPNGGVLTMTDEWPADTPPHWMVYIGVDDVDEAADRVRQAGGEVHVPPMDIPVGRFSVVSDPGGAYFTLFRGGDMVE